MTRFQDVEPAGFSDDAEVEGDDHALGLVEE